MEKRTPASKHTHSAGKQSNKNRRHTQESHMRPRLAPDSVKKKKPIASAPHSSTPSSRRMDDIRLIIESSLSDNYMMKKISKVRDELQAVELALADDGTYLGIVDKGELEKRKGQLKRRIRLLQEEGELMQTLRHQLAEAEDEQAAAELADRRLPSSPSVSVQRASSGSGGGGSSSSGSSSSSDTNAKSTTIHAAERSSPSARVASAATGAAAESPPSTRKRQKQWSPPVAENGGGRTTAKSPTIHAAERSSPSARVASAATGAAAGSPPPTGKRQNVYQLLPPGEGKGGSGGGSIGDFLKKSSAALGKKLAMTGTGGAGVPSSLYSSP